MHITVDIRGASLLAAVTGKIAAMQAALLRTMNRLSIEVQTGVKEKLTGRVLHVRTGTLRRSINRRVEEHGGSVMATVGTNVKYAGIHEFGFKGTVSVREHVRRTRSGATQVRAHARNVDIQERSFLRSTVDEMAPHIKAEIRKAVLGAVRA